MQLTYSQYLWWLLLLPVLGIGYYFSLVDRPQKLKIASFALRVLAIVLLIFALCRPAYRTDSKDLHVVFLVDVSQSVDLGAAKSALEQVKTATAKLASGDSSSLYFLANGIRPTTLD